MPLKVMMKELQPILENMRDPSWADGFGKTQKQMGLNIIYTAMA